MAYKDEGEWLGSWDCTDFVEQVRKHDATLIDTHPRGYRDADRDAVRGLFGDYLQMCLLPNESLSWCTLATVFPGGVITLHSDGTRGYVRRHLVLQTNPLAWSFHDGTWTHLQLGRCYSMDPLQPHGSVNWGPDKRIHLMFDTLTT